MCHCEDFSRRRRLHARDRWDEMMRSRDGALRITYPRARGLFKCKHNVVPGRIVPLSVILQFNLRSRGSADAARPGKRRERSLARSFIVTLLNLRPSIMTILLSFFRSYLSLCLSTFEILPRAFFFRLHQSCALENTIPVFSLPLSVIVRVFRISSYNLWAASSPRFCRSMQM